MPICREAGHKSRLTLPATERLLDLRSIALKWRRGLYRVPGFLSQVELARATADSYGETRCRLRYSFLHADSLLSPLTRLAVAHFVFAGGAAAGAGSAGLVCEKSQVDQRAANGADGNSGALVSGREALRGREGSFCGGGASCSNR